jgi:hypothetical protein
MRPDAYKAEAMRRATTATHDLTARFGAWNADKITKEMEKLLRDRRKGHDRERI